MVQSMSEQKIPAVVLAAGMSTRMGAFKPLMRLGGELLIRRVIGALESSGMVGPIVVGAGHFAGALETALEGTGVTTVVNADFAKGEMLSSLRVGIGALPARAAGFVL